MKLEPRNIRALEIMGSAYYMTGDQKQANAAWQEALDIEPNNQAVAGYLTEVQ